MRRAGIACFMALLALAGACPAQPMARFGAVQGDVLFQKAGQDDFSAAVSGSVVELGDYVVTDVESEAELVFANGATVRIYELSQVRINEMFLSGDSGKLDLFLRTGTVETKTPAGALTRTDFAVTTPVATASIRGSHQLVGHSDGHGTTVTFLSGSGTTKSTKTGSSVNQSGGDSSSTDSNGDTQGPLGTSKSSSLPNFLPLGQDGSEKAATQQANRVRVRTFGDAASAESAAAAVGTASSPGRLRLTVETVP